MRIECKEEMFKHELLQACSEGYLEVVKVMLDSGALLGVYGPDNTTPLLEACVNKHVFVVRELIKRGVDVNYKTDGFTALHVACQVGVVSMVRSLIKAGADVNARTSTTGDTPLHIAASRGHLEVVKVLVEKGADMWARNDKEYTPQNLAVIKPSFDVIRFLEEKMFNNSQQK